MKHFLLILLALLVAGVAVAQTPLPKTGLAGTSHDITIATVRVGCKGCHAPHDGSLLNSGTQATGQILLWARVFSTQTFGSYSSPTATHLANIAEIGGNTPLVNTQVRMYSLLCMSCHDGVTTGTMIAPTNSSALGNPTNSLGLTNDHPINFDYPSAGVANVLATAAVVGTAGLKLFGATNSVQCATCHEPHNNTNSRFLRMANNTTLCTSCHL